MVNKLKKWILPLLAAAMLLTAALPSALAYFTTYTRAKGGYTIRLGSTTTIDEEVTGTQKILVISNTEGADVFVRARGYVGLDSGYELNYSGSGWTGPDENGWCYYGPAVPAGGGSNPLTVSVSNIPVNPDEGDSFNVIVIYEATPARYDADGNPSPDWTMKLDTGGTP